MANQSSIFEVVIAQSQGEEETECVTWKLAIQEEGEEVMRPWEDELSRFTGYWLMDESDVG